MHPIARERRGLRRATCVCRQSSIEIHIGWGEKRIGRGAWMGGCDQKGDRYFSDFVCSDAPSLRKLVTGYSDPVVAGRLSMIHGSIVLAKQSQLLFDAGAHQPRFQRCFFPKPCPGFTSTTWPGVSVRSLLSASTSITP